MTNSEEKKSLWVFPWKWAESFLIILALFLASFSIELITGRKIPSLTWPANLIALALIANVSLLLFIVSRKQKAFEWFYSIHASIASIVLIVIPSLIMALVPQQQTDSLFFIYDVTSSWTYAIAVIFFLVILGTVTIKRTARLTTKNIGFLLNHFGLWLCVASAHLGAGDMQKLNMYLEEGKNSWSGVANDNSTVNLDFAIKLRDFSIEEFPAKIMFVDSKTGDIIKENNKKLLFDPYIGQTFSYGKYDYLIDTMLMNSAPVLKRFEPVYGTGATQSIKLIRSGNNLPSDTIWVSSPSILYHQKMLQADSASTLVMARPEAKRFVSEITVFEKSGAIYDTLVEVNKPVSIAGWKVYQTSYNEAMGRWSVQSTVELVRDPWLPAVYAGFFLMIAGTFYLIWVGKRKEEE